MIEPSRPFARMHVCEKCGATGYDFDAHFTWCGMKVKILPDGAMPPGVLGVMTCGPNPENTVYLTDSQDTSSDRQT